MIPAIEQKKMDFIREIQQQQKCSPRIQNTLTKACSGLADKLYDAKEHFFYELIQNAEDNKYPNHNQLIIPEIAFIIDQKGILVQNNEIGFQFQDVNSLCDIGESKKEKSNERHQIGEKGIGFKSVFGISANPQIFSNGFRFQFFKNNPLGMIQPVWVDEKNFPNGIDLTKTNIYLPIDTESIFNIAKLKPINPILILFLRTLKKITYRDNINNIHFRISKKFLNNGCTVLEKEKLIAFSNQNQKETLKYLILGEIFQKPTFIIEKERELETKTTLEIAFPLTSLDLPDPGRGGNIFVFLPLDTEKNNTGFPFILQGDFLLNSSRGEILKENEWNLWLRDQIPTLFIKAIEKFKTISSLDVNFYSYIPTEIKDGFFAPIGPILLEKIKNTPCILDRDNEWKKPSEVLWSDPELEELISNNSLKKIINKSYITRKIENFFPVFELLNVHTLNLSHLCHMLEHLDWVETQTIDWFGKLYHYLGNCLANNESIYYKIETSPILKLDDGTLCTPSAAKQSPTKVFLRTEETREKIFSEKVRYMASELSSLKENDNHIAYFFKKMKIEPMSPIVIIRDIIIPFYKNLRDQLQSSCPIFETQNMDASLIFLKNYEEKLEQTDWEKLKNVIVIKSRDNPERSFIPSEMYLSNLYQPKLSIENLYLGSILKPVFVTEEYICNAETKTCLTWRDFFIQLGVNSLILPQKIQLLMEEIQDPDIINLVKPIQNKQFLVNYNFKPDFSLIISQKNRSFSTAVLQYLDQIWPDLENKTNLTLHCNYRWRSNKKYWYDSPSDHNLSIPTDWVKILQDIPWLPTIDGQFVHANEVYVLSKDFQIFANLVKKTLPFLAIEIKNHALLEVLRVNCTITLEFLCEILQTLHDTQNLELSLYARIYTYMWEKFFEPSGIKINNETTEKISLTESKSNLTDQLRQILSSKPLVFLPKMKNRFFTTQEIIWDVETDAERPNYKLIWGIVAESYPQLKDFFIQTLNILEKPSISDYQMRILNMATDFHQNPKKLPKERLFLLRFFYSELNSMLKNPILLENLKKDEKWQEFLGESIYYTKKDRFERNQNNLFLNDDENLYNLFKEFNEIHFWNIDMTDISKIAEFAEVGNVQKFSHCIQYEIDPTSGMEADISTIDQIKTFFPYVLRYINSKSHNIFNKSNLMNVLEVLSHLKCQVVENFEIRLSIKGTNVKNYSKQTHKKILILENTIYRDKSLQDLDLLVIEEAKWIAKQFFQSEITGLDDYLIRLFKMTSIDEIDLYLQRKNILHLSTDFYKILEPFFGEFEMDLLFGDISKEYYPDLDEYEVAHQDSKCNDANEDRTIASVKREIQDNLESNTEFPQNQRNDSNIVTKPNFNANHDISNYFANFERKNKYRRNPFLENQESFFEPNDPNIQPIIRELPKFNSRKIEISNDDEFLDLEEKCDQKNITNDNFNDSECTEENLDDLNNPSTSDSYSNSLVNDHDSNDEESFFDKKIQEENDYDKFSNKIQNERKKRNAGIWGEEFIFYLLIQQIKNKYHNHTILHETPYLFEMELNSKQIARIKRENPYAMGPRRSFDIVVIEPDGKFFIEVKSTSESKKKEFFISGAEWRFAQNIGKFYQIYCVEGAFTQRPLVTIISNPVEKWQKGELIASQLKIIYGK